MLVHIRRGRIIVLEDYVPTLRTYDAMPCAMAVIA
jgi:hypothetical protein